MSTRVLKAHHLSPVVSSRTLCGLKVDGSKQVPLHPTPDGHAECAVCSRIRTHANRNQPAPKGPAYEGPAIDGPAVNQGIDAPWL